MRTFIASLALLFALSRCESKPHKPWEKDASREKPQTWPQTQRAGESVDPRVPPNMYPSSSPPVTR